MLFEDQAEPPTGDENCLPNRCPKGPVGVSDGDSIFEKVEFPVGTVGVSDGDSIFESLESPTGDTVS